MFDVKKQAMEIATKIAKDKELQEEFKKDPVNAVEKAIGIDLPDGVTEKIVEVVKSQLAGEKAADAAEMIKKLL